MARRFGRRRSQSRVNECRIHRHPEFRPRLRIESQLLVACAAPFGQACHQSAQRLYMEPTRNSELPTGGACEATVRPCSRPAAAASETVELRQMSPCVGRVLQSWLARTRLDTSAIQWKDSQRRPSKFTHPTASCEIRGLVCLGTSPLRCMHSPAAVPHLPLRANGVAFGFQSGLA